MNHSTAVRASLTVVVSLGCTPPQGRAPQAQAPAATAHPEEWPAAHSPAALMDPRTEAMADMLLKPLTVEERVGQVIQADISSVKPDDLKTYPLGSVQAGGNSSPGNNERSPASAWVALLRDFRAANKTYWGTRTTIPIMFGIGEVTAREMAATGADWTYAPTVTVPRDHRWGRSDEGWSEDPEIVAQYAREITIGLQGELGEGSIAPGKIAATAKHFLADGGTEGGKDQGDARISEEELVRVHAAGYKPAIDAGLLTVMMSFSSWNGAKHTGNRSLITDVLKGRMGFTGSVINDWNSHGQVPGCHNDDCTQALNAGIDMYMVPSDWKGLFTNLTRQVKDGTVPMARLDDAVRRILRVKIKAGVFRTERPLEGRLDLLGTPEHRAEARLSDNEGDVICPAR